MLCDPRLGRGERFWRATEGGSLEPSGSQIPAMTAPVSRQQQRLAPSLQGTNTDGAV